MVERERRGVFLADLERYVVQTRRTFETLANRLDWTPESLSEASLDRERGFGEKTSAFSRAERHCFVIERLFALRFDAKARESSSRRRFGAKNRSQIQFFLTH